MSRAPQTCPSDETLALFAAGMADAQTRVTVLAHIEHCGECMAAVLAVNEHLEEEAGSESAQPEPTPATSPRLRWWTGAAAAAVLALVISVPLLQRRASPIGALVDLAPASQRIVEPRLSGGFAWAPYRGPVRATNGSAQAARLKLGGAAGEVIERAERDRGAEAQHAAGVAMVLVEEPEEAMVRLETAARTSRDAAVWNDLAAARYAAAVRFGRTSLLPLALAAADEALRIDARFAEALFNRALILERMGVGPEARRAWEQYLEVDPGSRWAEEARERLSALPAASGSAHFERNQPQLERAALAGDAAAVRALADAHRERFRAFGEAEYLGRWAEAVQRHDEVAAARWLTVARAIGGALAGLSGEALLRDAVRAIDDADPATRTVLADAHATYRRGRIAYSRRQREAGERDLRRAAALFASAGTPMSLMARHYAAGARLARNDVAGAREELVRLRADADAHPSYLALGGHVRWELSRALASGGEIAARVPVLTEAAALFRRAGEPMNEAAVEALLGGALRSHGRADEAWAAFVRTFRVLSTVGTSDRLEVNVGGAAYLELQAGRRDAALALTRLAESLQRDGAEPILAIETLLRRAMLEAAAGNEADAEPSLRRAAELAARLPDADMRARQLADVDAVRGAQLLARDPRAAEAALTRAIEFHRAHDRFANLPEPLLLRARSTLRLGRTADAERDLEEGVQLLERHALRHDRALLGTGVLDAGRALYADAIRLRLARGDVAGAFAYAERARGGDVSLSELRQRLAGSRMAVLVMAALPDELVTFAVSADDVLVARRPRVEAELAALAERCRSGDDAAATTLHEDVVRPVERVVARAEALIVVADPIVAGVQFASLFDNESRRYLVERLPVAIASSASSLRPGARGGRLSIAGVALPVFDGAEALPQAERELGDIAALYPSATILPPAGATWPAFQRAASPADVVHIAGHTERQAGDAGQALLFAGSGGASADSVSWKTIVDAPPLAARVVVLAACETLHPSRSFDTRTLSLGAAFASAGADVVGTLIPIPDRDAHALFHSLHRQLAAGQSPAAAVRAVQIEAIRRESAGGSARAWRALAVLTRHIQPRERT